MRLTAVLWNEFIFFIHLYIHVHCSVAPAHLVGLVITNCIDEIVSIGIQCFKKENISVETLTLLESKFQKKLRQSKKNKESRYVRRSRREREREREPPSFCRK